MSRPPGQPVDVIASTISAPTPGDYIAFGVFIGLLVGAFGWLFHTGGRDARADASTSVGRSVGTVLCAVGIIGYLAAAVIAGVGGYGAWNAWRAERAEVAESSTIESPLDTESGRGRRTPRR